MTVPMRHHFTMINGLFDPSSPYNFGRFDNPEFVRRNVIAAEVEKVMLAMTSQSFDRNTYLKDLRASKHTRSNYEVDASKSSSSRGS